MKKKVNFEAASNMEIKLAVPLIPCKSFSVTSTAGLRFPREPLLFSLANSTPFLIFFFFLSCPFPLASATRSFRSLYSYHRCFIPFPLSFPRPGPLQVHRTLSAILHRRFSSLFSRKRVEPPGYRVDFDNYFGLASKYFILQPPEAFRS